jgi:hypothetical protein
MLLPIGLRGERTAAVLARRPAVAVVFGVLAAPAPALATITAVNNARPILM